MVRATKILSVCLSVIAIYTNNVLFFFRKHKHCFCFFFLVFYVDHIQMRTPPHTPWQHARESGLLISSSSQYTVNKINSIFTIKYLAG